MYTAVGSGELLDALTLEIRHRRQEAGNPPKLSILAGYTHGANSTLQTVTFRIFDVIESTALHVILFQRHARVYTMLFYSCSIYHEIYNTGALLILFTVCLSNFHIETYAKLLYTINYIRNKWCLFPYVLTCSIVFRVSATLPMI